MMLHHADEGSGEPVIVMHGLFGSISNWKGIARRLAGNYRVISVDLRNHGRSPWDDDVSYPAMAGDVTDLMDRLELPGAALVGHSMGGKVAMTLALSAPRRVTALAVVDIAPVAYEHTHEALIDTLREVDLERVKKRADLDRHLAPAVPQAALRAFLGQNLVHDDGAYRWRVNLDALARGMSSLTGFPDLEGARYEGDCVFVYGEASDYVAIRHLAEIHVRFPAAKLVGVPGAGHWVHAEQPGVIVDEVNELLDSRPSS